MVVVKRVFLMVAASALVVAGSASAEAPPAPLLRAESQTAHATSERMTMVMSVSAAGKTVRLTTTGVERVKAHQASMVIDMSKLNPTIGKMEMLLIGSRFYMHFHLLDKLHAKSPQVKQWIVAKSASAIGFDPWSPGSFHSSLRAASGYRLLGTSGGVSRYSAEINLRTAVASNPQLKQLFARAGAAASGLLARPVPVVLYVGSDGYLHRMTERFTIPIGGKTLSMTMDMRLSDFNVDPGPLIAPPADQTMTLKRFEQLTNTTTISYRGRQLPHRQHWTL